MPTLSEYSNLVWNGAVAAPSQEKKSSKYNIFALPAGWSGCAFWRYRLPLNKLKKLGSGLSINIADNPDKIVRTNEIQEHVQSADLITIQAPGYKDAHFLMQIYRGQNKKVVIDYDDFSFDLSPSNPRYSELGTKEAEEMGYDGTPAFKWRDQENEFDLKANIEKYAAFKKCVATADLITVTTEYLADKFRPYNSNVAICPNSIDFDLWKPIPRPDIFNKQIRIGWFGGDSHFIDLPIFKTLLPRICKKYPAVKIVLQAPMVPQWREFFKEIPPSQLEWHGWTDLKLYTLSLAAKWWDIGLCPLGDNDFNRCKSNIKCLEFASLGVPVVAQNMIPYSNHIRHAETGFLAKTEEEWFSWISLLIEQDNLRKNIAAKAYQDAFERFNLDKNCRIWEQTYINCIENKNGGKSTCGPA